ncbi:response regulator transcription factor [Runella sp.]|uniref:response regulator transcription factor n=1 Tax=Runella sp. TaxID=1960881 RepID=UPI00301616B6
MQEPINILIVDDHDLMLCGIEFVLEKYEQYQIIQKCSSVESALTFLKKTTVDLIITDLHFQDNTGIELTIEVKKRDPKQKILMLTLEDHPEYIRAAMNANINGYVLKSDEQKKFLLAVEEICRVGEYFSPAVTRILSSMPQAQKAIESEALPPAYYHLTPREREVLALIAKSETNTEIMEKLKIVAPTLATHRQNLLRKLGEKNDVGLSKFAFKYGLVKWE